jgi:hypothetical protein
MSHVLLQLLATLFKFLRTQSFSIQLKKDPIRRLSSENYSLDGDNFSIDQSLACCVFMETHIKSHWLSTVWSTNATYHSAGSTLLSLHDHARHSYAMTQQKQSLDMSAALDTTTDHYILIHCPFIMQNLFVLNLLFILYATYHSVA